MKCSEIRELISCMLDQELSAEDSAIVTEHLAECPECMRVFEAFHSISVSLEELEDVPSGFTEAVMSRINTPTARNKHRPVFRRLIGLAACVALVLLAGSNFIPKYANITGNAQDTAQYTLIGRQTPKPTATPTPYADQARIGDGDTGSGDTAEDLGVSLALAPETTDALLAPNATVSSVPVPTPTPTPAPTATPKPTPELIIPEDLLIVVVDANEQLHTQSPDYTLILNDENGNPVELSIWMEADRIYCKNTETGAAWYTVGTPEKLMEILRNTGIAQVTPQPVTTQKAQ